MSNTRILIVEDESIVAFDLEESVRAMGYDVVGVVNNGPEAILKADQLKPDVILMDIRLKGEQDGIHAAEIINSRMEDLIIIFMTAHSDSTTQKRAERTNPYGYLVKPYDYSTLKNTISEILANKRNGIPNA